MTATCIVVDFTNDETLPDPPPLTGSREPVSFGVNGKIIGRPVVSLQPKQTRQRARRKMKIAHDEIALLYGDYPIERWDIEELARGRPRAKDGSFKGRAPMFLERSVHEQIVRRFEVIVKDEMNGHTVEALRVIKHILVNTQEDEKGRPKVSASTKLDAAKFLVEHVLGKPKQHIENDISVKLQGILGHAMINPGRDGKFELSQGYVEAESWEEDDLTTE